MRGEELVIFLLKERGAGTCWRRRFKKIESVPACVTQKIAHAVPAMIPNGGNLFREGSWSNEKQSPVPLKMGWSAQAMLWMSDAIAPMAFGRARHMGK
ncbi:hypothetical protein D3227_23870 [Mesorhizobium waimense]|uniref:Uncharacterized protein n=1 Tax=Mesorhizobium waimense TaxID=1300307 RepID=A0A3A5KN94_9HYPH|nr:hypothetical protein D3227_23870 [Mesorhizobium waimense]